MTLTDGKTIEEGGAGSTRARIYRAEALAHHAAGADGRAQHVLRVSTRWVRWAYGLVLFGAAGVVLAIAAHLFQIGAAMGGR